MRVDFFCQIKVSINQPLVYNIIH